MKDKILNANDCPNYSSEEGCDCNYLKECQYSTPSSAQPVKEGKKDEQFEADVKHSFKCWNTGLGLVVPGLVKSLADKGITLAKQQQPVTPPASTEVKSLDVFANEMIQEFEFAQSHNKNYAQYDNGIRDASALFKLKYKAYAAQHQQSEGMEEKLLNAFEAGQSFASECFCGECDYCLLFPDKSPDFMTWYRQLTQNDKTKLK